MRISLKKVDRDTWLKMRQKGIGGSDAGTICGLNKYKSPLQLYYEKISNGDEQIEQPDNEYMYWGRNTEDMVAKEFANQTGKTVKRTNFMYISANYPYLLADVDRLIYDSPDLNAKPTAILECKTTSEYNSDEWRDDEIPASYIMQVQHYLYVLDMDQAYIAALIGGHHFIYKPIPRDDDLIHYMLQKELKFWDNVTTHTPPEVSAIDTQLLDRKYPSATKKSINADVTISDILDKYALLKSEIKEKEDQLTLLENQIKDYMKDYEIVLGDNHIAKWTNGKYNYFDVKEFRKENGELYQKFSISKDIRKFQITERKENNNG